METPRPSAPAPACPRALVRSAAYTALSMAAFAGNSLLCRLALMNGHIDAASFSAARILSGAIVLWLIVRTRARGNAAAGNWASASALFLYVAFFSAAYLSLPAGTGALLLFGTVQATMIVQALRTGERLGLGQAAGFALCVAGLIALLMPGLTAPPPGSSLMMIAAGVAWGVYSLRGRASADPLETTAGNFIRAALPAALLGAVLFPWARFDAAGLLLAVISGAVTSGIGYVVWYTALRDLTSSSAAVVQLSVPVLTALGGIVFLGESLTLRLLLSSLAVLGGIALVIGRAEGARGRTS